MINLEAYIFPIVWTTVFVICLVIEGLTCDMTSVWFAIGSLFGLGVSFIDSSPLVIILSVVTFFVTSSLSLVIFKTLCPKWLKSKSVIKEDYVGRISRLEQKITKDIDSYVYIDDVLWQATSDMTMSKGTKVIVVKQTGNVLTVEKYEEPDKVEEKEE